MSKRFTVLGMLALLLLGMGSAQAVAAPADPEWTTTATVWKNPAVTNPHVKNLRYATHPGFDRVVVDIDGRVPGYRLSFVRQLRHDGSGTPARLEGRYKLQLSLNPASAHRDSDGSSTYDGPMRRNHLGFPALKGLAFLGDFEGRVTFGFSSDSKPYRVFRLYNPSRIVIDFKH